MAALDGYKTYLLSLVGGIVTVLYFLDVIEWQTYEGLLGLLGFSGLVTLRSAVKKVEPKP
jgi:hypothetical protein